MRDPGVRRVVLPLAVCALLACGGEAAPGPAEGSAAGSQPDAVRRVDATAFGEVEPAAAGGDAHRKPLPAFRGFTLSGERLSVSSLLGRRLLLFFFNPEAREAEAAGEAVARIAELAGGHNFEILGVAMGAPPDAARAFLARHGLELRTLDDSSARIANRLGVRSRVAFLGVDAEGYVRFGFAGPGGADEPAALIEGLLRERLRLPEAGAALAAGPGRFPEAPAFEAPRLDPGAEPFRLADWRGRPVVLIFFLHTCPHCHAALRALREQLPKLPEAKRPRLVGVSLVDKPAAVRSALADEELDYFPVALDAGGEVSRAYGVRGSVPDLLLIDAEGRIRSRTKGWRDDRDPPLLRMRLAKLAGVRPPLLLDPVGYSGSEFCGVCHEPEHATWELTDHAGAFDTLVRHGADADPECVGCHVVGFGETGGYTISPPTPHFEGVGCESCHGRGGPHLSPGFVADGSYESACATCHDPKHSLGFEYASFLPRVSHAANAHLLALSEVERRERLAERGRRGSELLPSQAEWVGSEACRSCHAAEYATWSEGGHARAGATLEAEGRAGDAECLRCHTTGFGETGGFPRGAELSAHPDLGRVGCESCHGPGGDHVPADAPKTGTIVSLGDKCDSCVILKICGGCHDDANDPGFEFEVQEKIDAQRHGTIEPGTGRPKEPGDRAALDAATRGALAHAFATARGEERTWTRR